MKKTRNRRSVQLAQHGKDSTLCKTFNNFLELTLCTKGRTASKHLLAVSRYFAFASLPNSTKRPKEVIFYSVMSSTFTSYIHDVKRNPDKKFGSTSNCINTVSGLEKLFDFCVFYAPDVCTSSQIPLYNMKIESLKVLLRNTRKCLRAVKQESVNNDVAEQKPNLPLPSYGRIANVISRIVLPEIRRLICKAKTSALSTTEYSRSLQICAGLCALNQQPTRSMEMQTAPYSTMMEGLLQCKTGGYQSNWVFRTNKLKTAPTYKVKGVVFTPQNSKILLAWAKYIRRGTSERFFTSSVGTPVSNYSELIGKFTYHYFGIWLTLTSIRSLMETRGRNYK